MGGRQVGRSEPAFGVASTTALPPPTCTAWREAGQLDRQLLFCCEACAVRIVRRLCSPAAALFSRLCSLACLPLPCHAHCPHRLPRSVHFALPPPVHVHVRQDHRSRKLYELSRWQLQRGPAVAARAPVHLLTFCPFSCRVH